MADKTTIPGSLDDIDLDAPENQAPIDPPKGLKVKFETAFIGLRKWPSGDVAFDYSLKIVDVTDPEQAKEYQGKTFKSVRDTFTPPCPLMDERQRRRALNGCQTFRQAFGIKQQTFKQVISDATETFEAGADGEQLKNDLQPFLGLTCQGIVSHDKNGYARPGVLVAIEQ